MKENKKNDLCSNDETYVYRITKYEETMRKKWIVKMWQQSWIDEEPSIKLLLHETLKLDSQRPLE